MKNMACKWFLLGGVSLLALAGCNKQGIDATFSRKAGEEVVFGTVSRSMSRPGSKTVYSGVVTEGKERIDWKVNDQFRVYSNAAKHRYLDQNWADYKIARAESITASGAESIVTFGDIYNPGIVPITKNSAGSENGLVWGDPGDYTFWGVYPVPAAVDAEGKAGKFTFSIPTAQDADVDKNMGFAYMTAYQQVSTTSENGAPVELAFEPAYTAFQFIIESQDESITLKNFTLTSDAKSLSGDYTVAYNGANRSFTDANDPPKKTITVDLGDQKISPATESAEAKKVTFTVLAQPQTFNDLTISFEVTVRNETDVQNRILALTQNGTGVEFGALRKHIIKGIAMPGDLWKLYYQPDFLNVDKWVEIGTTTNVIVE